MFCFWAHGNAHQLPLPVANFILSLTVVFEVVGQDMGAVQPKCCAAQAKSGVGHFGWTQEHLSMFAHSRENTISSSEALFMLQEVQNTSSEAASETKLVSDQPIPPVGKPLWLSEAWHCDFLTTCTQRDDCFWDNLYEKSKKIDGSTWDLDWGPKLRPRNMSPCSCLASFRNACGERNESLALSSLAQLFIWSWIASLSLALVV